MPAERTRSTKWWVALISFIVIIPGTLCSFVFQVRASSSDSTGTVFIVFAIDTEPARFNPWQYEQNLDFSCFAKKGPNSRVAKIMDLNWRRQYRDSSGNLPRFSWFIMAHEAFRHAAHGGCCCVYDAITNYRESIMEYGDEIAWHYHHADWSDPDGDGKSSWNQLTTFDGSNYCHGTDVEIAERLLNRLLVERGIFPTAFRAGWVWENNDLSRWLENVIPFDFSAYPPNKTGPAKHEPLRNNYDWSRASRLYSGYHPDLKDYQKGGHMHRWIFRTIAPNNRHTWEKIFKAAKNDDQILCLTAHSYDNIAAQIDSFLPDLLRLGDSLGVSMEFASASRAGAIIGKEIESSVNLEIAENGDNLIIQVGRPIFQTFPYCVLIEESGDCARVMPRSDGTLRWVFDISRLSHFRFVCAACTPGGITEIAEFSR